MNAIAERESSKSRGFEPMNVPRLYRRLEIDFDQLLLELTNCIIMDLLPDDLEAIQSSYYRAWDSFNDFEARYDLHARCERWSSCNEHEDAIRAAFPESERDELEAQAKEVVEAFQAYRDTAIEVTGQRLARTRPVAPSPTEQGISALCSLGQQLEADYEQLSQAVSHLARFYDDRMPSIAGLWERATGSYDQLRAELGVSNRPVVGTEGAAAKAAPLWEMIPSENSDAIAALIQTTIDHLAEVRLWLLSAVTEDLSESVHEYDPDWASPASRVILNSHIEGPSL